MSTTHDQYEVAGEEPVEWSINKFNAQMCLGTAGLLEQCEIWSKAKRLSPESFKVFCEGTHLPQDSHDFLAIDLLSERYRQLAECFGTRLESIAVLLLLMADPDQDFDETVSKVRSFDREHAGRLRDEIVDAYWNWLDAHHNQNGGWYQIDNSQAE
jgi:hypothetical protein